MSGGGNDVWDSHRNGNGGGCALWGAKESTGGSPYFTQDFMYMHSNNTQEEPGMEYPAAAYIATDFHCERSLNSWTDPFILNNGWLVGLSDLDTESDYVRERIAAYLTELISIGFSGFRIDAAKHIYPESLSAIFKKFKDNLGGGDLPEDFTTYLEVIMGGEMDLLMCQDGIYNFGKSFEDKMRAAGLSESDIMKVRFGKVLIQKNSQSVDPGRFLLRDLLLKMTATMIKIQVHHPEIWEIRDPFSLRIRTSICTETSKSNFSRELTATGKLRPSSLPTLS